jgi:hypothetical protein
MTPRWIRPFATDTLSGLLICVLASLPVAAAEKERCEGTKKERRQKMALRDVTKTQLLEMQGPYATESIADRKHLSDTVLRRLEREYENHLKTGAEFVFDVLVLSGGGAKGAFGAGFMEGWGTLPPGPNARPDFDIVTGVSTGALISPYAFIGTDEAYTSIAQFFANPEENWVKKRGALYFKKGHVSLFNNSASCKIRESDTEIFRPSSPSGRRDTGPTMDLSPL